MAALGAGRPDNKNKIKMATNGSRGKLGRARCCQGFRESVTSGLPRRFAQTAAAVSGFLAAGDIKSNAERRSTLTMNCPRGGGGGMDERVIQVSAFAVSRAAKSPSLEARGHNVTRHGVVPDQNRGGNDSTRTNGANGALPSAGSAARKVQTLRHCATTHASRRQGSQRPTNSRGGGKRETRPAEHNSLPGVGVARAARAREA